ncbi:tetratricopeptide repeat protein [Chitinimonas sp.]|uniref:tetratricopeptide repeat protein n=1 Tax=Chitinimonas sp. TaxID=1934313 RepID=UPI002F91F0D0
MLTPVLATLLATTPAQALDLAALWDFNQPAQSEQRLRAALAGATPDQALILQTQIARSYGLRQDFEQARAILTPLAAQLPTASAEVKTRYALELGRTYASATHPPATQTTQAKARAGELYRQALAEARKGGLDDLAIDALHMLAFVDTAPADQLHWADEALAIATTSSQPKAQKWAASLRNNKGYALHQLGRYEEALVEFQAALTLREQGDNAGAKRIARWMVAWTLRALKRDDEALAMQLQLEKDCAAAGEPDPEVYTELALLYEARGDADKAQHYRELKERTPD